MPAFVVEKAVPNLAAGIAIVMLGATLAGCAVEPTEAELKKAIQAEMDRTNELAATMLGQEVAAKTATRIHGVNKLNCKKDEVDNEYLCGVEVDITAPPAERRKLASRVRMAKQDNGWMLVKTF